MSETKGPVKTSVYLPQDALDALRRMSETRGSTMAQVLRQAIATENYLDKETAEGGEVLIKRGKEVRQLVRF